VALTPFDHLLAVILAVVIVDPAPIGFPGGSGAPKTSRACAAAYSRRCASSRLVLALVFSGCGASRAARRGAGPGRRDVYLHGRRGGRSSSLRLVRAGACVRIGRSLERVRPAGASCSCSRTRWRTAAVPVAVPHGGVWRSCSIGAFCSSISVTGCRSCVCSLVRDLRARARLSGVRGPAHGLWGLPRRRLHAVGSIVPRCLHAPRHVFGLDAHAALRREARRRAPLTDPVYDLQRSWKSRAGAARGSGRGTSWRARKVVDGP